MINIFLSAEDKFMPEMHLRQSGFTYCACGQFTKKKKGLQRIKGTEDSKYIDQNEL